MEQIGTYNYSLVALSVVVAALASYTALNLATRVKASSGWPRYAWLGAAAFAMGGGIWSMHFVAMMAFSLPGMAVGYDWTLTLLSLLLPIMVTAFGFFVVIQPGTGWVGLTLSGIVMGFGIAGMHYTGMAAMQMPAGLHHEPIWVASSIAIAIVAATVALWLAFQHTSSTERFLAALVMGAAISGMHYTAMHGALFTAIGAMNHVATPSVDQTQLALWIACKTVVFLLLGLVAAVYDRRLVSRTERGAAALRQVCETSHLYQGLMTVDGTLTYINSTALAGIGAKLEDVVDRPFWETPWFSATPQMPQAVKEAVANAAAGNSQTDRMTLDLPTGTRVFDFSFRPVKDAAGKVTAIVPEAADVTARVLAEQTLQQALKMEALGNLTGGIAHDFNNLLMAVMGSLELLRRKLPDDPKMLRLLDNAAEGAKRGAALTQRMLSFARQQPLNPISVDLPDLVRGMTDLLRRSIGPAISIDTHFPLDLPQATVDANQLELALLNLAVNARDAMPMGGTITIAAREAGGAGMHGLAPGRYVCLSVTDSGRGMDAQTLARAKEPFFTTKGVGKGTGLGLSMAHGLAEQSGGRLVLKSGLGEGTTAEVWLPVSTISPRVPRASAPTPPPQHPRSSLCVMVVDDDLLVLENTVAMLEDLGHRVIAARSGEEAKKRIPETRTLDLVITDHAMPGLTGVQLAEWLKTERPQIRVLLATGFAELPSDAQSTPLPRLNKPFDQSALARAIGDAMRTASVLQLRPKSA